MSQEIVIVNSCAWQDKINWIRLLRTRGVSRNSIMNLLKIFGNVNDIVENIGQYSLNGGLKNPISLISSDEAKKELESIYKFGAQIICFNEELFPPLLRQIPDSPLLLTVKGNIDLIKRDAVAIVGPRNASLNGCRFAQKIAHDLGQKGIVIVSGLARGIDASAHQASINSGTIGVIACGIDQIYPLENTQLFSQIIENGLLVSEMQFGAPPKGGNFVQRNRIISGLSVGVVVVEATLRSGTLITARFALEQNREIFAVPGFPFDPRYEGTNRLIKQGAILIENSNDVLEVVTEIIKNRQRFELNDSFDSRIEIKFKAPDDKIIDQVRKNILDKIDYTPVLVEILISELQIPAKIANIALTQLELAGRVEYKNGRVSLVIS